MRTSRSERKGDLLEATSFIRDTGIGLVAEEAEAILRGFRAVWVRRFGFLRTANEDVLSRAPGISEQLYDCAAELVEANPAGDALEMMRILETYVSWDSTRSRSPFGFSVSSSKTVIQY